MYRVLLITEGHRERKYYAEVEMLQESECVTGNWKCYKSGNIGKWKCYRKADMLHLKWQCFTEVYVFNIFTLLCILPMLEKHNHLITGLSKLVYRIFFYFKNYTSVYY